MIELIDWVEEQAQENLKFRLACLESLLKEANLTLAILLAGFGTSSAYILKTLTATDQTAWLAAGVTGLSLYLMALCGIVILKCLAIKEIQVPTNEPENLYQKKYTLLKIREVELRNTQTRINKATARNSEIAGWLNTTRLLILATPLVFLISSFSVFCF